MTEETAPKKTPTPRKPRATPRRKPTTWKEPAPRVKPRIAHFLIQAVVYADSGDVLQAVPVAQVQKRPDQLKAWMDGLPAELEVLEAQLNGDEVKSA